jgi:biotin carboxyl carrier protein
MKRIIEVNGREFVIEVEQRDGRAEFRVNGRPLEADACEVEPGVYSVLSEGRSFEVKIEELPGQMRAHVIGKPYPFSIRVRDPRRRRAAGTLAAEGCQNITSPMPGKVIRVLVEEQHQVKAGQGLIVVEAMKMQNEIKSSKDGVVTKISARPGATVTAGETLLVVE